MIVLRLCALLLFCQVHVSYSKHLIKHIDFVVEQFKRHRTVEFYEEIRGVSSVILRRGNDFKFGLQLNDQFNGHQVHAVLSFDTKKDQMTVQLPLLGRRHGWRMHQSGGGKEINVAISIPSNAPVGVWRMKLILKSRTGKTLEQLTAPNKIIILFNPWDKDDGAYFPEQQKLSEYLMNERGYMYSYDWETRSSRRWIFGQFQNGVLDAVLFALGRSQLRAAQRGDVVLVARELTYLMNDDGGANRGVIQGRWKEPFDTIDGRPATEPWEWTGSPAIFKEYMENGGKTVGFGQCWVFAGLLTTSYRALGIAARPVSNFLSAHSRQRDLTVDIHLDEAGEISRQEMVWNFHVWVQAWFRRSDLGSSYTGWQELDSTPQEMNNGRFQVGPASNYALRTSQLNRRYESAFLYEEVNADEVVWSPKKEIVSVNRKNVGIALLTKEYGGEGAVDITRMYKPKEGTPEERRSYELAAKSLGIRPPSLYSPHRRSNKIMVTIDILTPNSTVVGSTVFLKVKLQNPSSSAKKLDVRVKISAIYYNGKVAYVLKKLKKTIELSGLSSQTLEFNVKPEEYFGKLRQYSTIHIESSATNGKSIIFKQKRFSLVNPGLIVKGPKLVNVNQTFTMNVEIKNPYNRPLSNNFIAIEGVRIKRKVIPVRDIAANSRQTATISLSSSYAHKEALGVHFYSKKVIEMLGSVEFTVKGVTSYQFANFRIRPPRLNVDSFFSNLEEHLLNEQKASGFIPTIDEFDCCDINKIR